MPPPPGREGPIRDARRNGNDLGGGDRADAHRLLEAPPPAPGRPGNQPRTGRRRRSCSTTPAADPRGRHRHPPAALDGERAKGAAGDDQQRHLVRDRGDRLFAAGHVGERLDLRLVGEQEVEPAAVDKGQASSRCGAMQAMSDRVSATLRRPRGRCAAPRARRARSPLSATDRLRDRGSRRRGSAAGRGVARQLAGGAAEGVHRPLRIGRDQDQQRPGRLAARSGGVTNSTPRARMSWVKISPS